MDGILVIDKPTGMTSHDVVDRVRRVLGTRRVGHTGTLDPFATGVMVLLIGNATRLARFLDKDDKEYSADVQFGFETDTGDRTGQQKGERKDAALVAGALRQMDWDAVLEEFRGEQMQTPPMYSAKKIDGKRLYELARKGEEVERRPVPISIRELALVDDSELADGRIVLHVACSAGTYIRTLAEDIGRRIGLGAHLANLRRTAAGQFDVRASCTLDELQSQSPDFKLLPQDLAAAHLPEFALDAGRLDATRNGLASRVTGREYPPDEFVRMTCDGSLIAIGVYNGIDKTVKPKIVLV